MGKSSFLKSVVALLFVLAVGTMEAAAQRIAPPTPQPAPPAPPAGQQAGAQASKTEIVATHGKWQVQCTDVPAGSPPQQPPAAAEGEDGKSDEASKPAASASARPETTKQCGMLQNTQATDRKGVSLTLVMAATRQGEKMITMMRILVPVGVYLPLGIALEIDGDPVGRVPFTRCLPQTCIAVAEAKKETLGKMRKGAKANFIIYEQPGVGVTLPVSLEGFTAAHKKLLEL